MLREPADNDGVQTFTIKRHAGTVKKINRSQKHYLGSLQIDEKLKST